MTVKNAVKKIERLSGLKVERNANRLYFITYKNNVLSFYPNGRDEENADITCIKTRRTYDHDDSMSDYSAGCFHDNITQAWNFIKND